MVDKHGIGTDGISGGRDGVDIGASQPQPARRQNLDGPIYIKALAIHLVWIIGQFVVFKAVDYGIVVHIHAKKKIRRVYPVPQKRLHVIRLEIPILIEIRDEIVILVEARENATTQIPVVARSLIDGPSAPIGEPVLVVVVVDELEDCCTGVIEKQLPPVIYQKGAGRIAITEAVDLTVGRPGKGIVLGDQEEGFRFVRCQLVLCGPDLGVGIRKSPVSPVESGFSLQSEAPQIHQVQGCAEHFVACRKSVFKGHDPHIGAIAHIPLGPCHLEKDRIPSSIQLHIGTDRDPVVVGQH